MLKNFDITWDDSDNVNMMLHFKDDVILRLKHIQYDEGYEENMENLNTILRLEEGGETLEGAHPCDGCSFYFKLWSLYYNRSSSSDDDDDDDDDAKHKNHENCTHFEFLPENKTVLISDWQHHEKEWWPANLQASEPKYTYSLNDIRMFRNIFQIIADKTASTR
jgi:hypothetical protein